MPISKKIIDKVNSLEQDEDFKKLVLDILNEEDKGNHRYKEKYEQIIEEYLNNSKEKDENDQN